jgi:hypothetical protein
MKSDREKSSRQEALMKSRSTAQPDLAELYEQLLRLREKVRALSEKAESSGQRSGG